MSRIFISHSSDDNREALALQQWLLCNHWSPEDIFLDTDPSHGIRVGEKWRNILKARVKTCEAVVVLVSPSWSSSTWCDRELTSGTNWDKPIFGVVIKQVAQNNKLAELMAEWQLCDLVDKHPLEEIHFKYNDKSDCVSFSVEGLKRLRLGLENIGIGSQYFPWPPEWQPEREPYRGLSPLEAEDAAVFFGRDAEILSVLDELRAMRAGVDKRVLVILGASGAGKSSFLRAGLLPRLERSDKRFFPLQSIRPGIEPIFGGEGLAESLYKPFKHQADASLGGFKEIIEKNPVKGVLSILARIGGMAVERFQRHGAAGVDISPTIVIPFDQADELFNPDAGQEARKLLKVLGVMLRVNNLMTQGEVPVRICLILIFTIRSDRYGPLQTSVALKSIRNAVLVDLKPISPAYFTEIIKKPAERAAKSGPPLDVEPKLVERLVEDSKQGADALPLLGLTLQRLYHNRKRKDKLAYEDYDRHMSLGNVIRSVVDDVLDRNESVRERQLEILHAAFIPCLATINPQNEQPLRRLAGMEDLPEESHVLIEALVQARLLVKKYESQRAVIEVAHEALLRNWDVLAVWLEAERKNLIDVEMLEHDVMAWEKNGQKYSWMLKEERLAVAEALLAMPRFKKRLAYCQGFIAESRRNEDLRRNDEIEGERRNAEREQQRRKQVEKDGEIIAGLGIAILVAAVVLAWMYSKARDAALSEGAMRLTLGAQYILYVDNEEERALLGLLAANRIYAGLGGGDRREEVRHSIYPLENNNESFINKALRGGLARIANVVKFVAPGQRVIGVGFECNDPDGVVFGDESGMVWRWRLDGKAGVKVRPDMMVNKISAVGIQSFIAKRNIDGNDEGLCVVRAVFPSVDGKLIFWSSLDNSRGEKETSNFENGFSAEIIALDRWEHLIAAGNSDGTVRVWNAENGRLVAQPLLGHGFPVWAVAFSHDGNLLVSGDEQGEMRVWDLRSGKLIAEVNRGYGAKVTKLIFLGDNNHFFSSHLDGTLRLWNIKLNRMVGEPLKIGDDRAFGFSISSDESRLVVGDSNGVLKLWDFSNDLSMKSDGDKNVLLSHWMGNDFLGKTLQVHGHRGPIEIIVFNPGGDRIISYGVDRTMRLWEIDNLNPLSVPTVGKGKNSKASEGAMGVTDSSITLQTGVGSPRLEPLDIQLCAKMGRNMSAKEWEVMVSAEFEYQEQCYDLPKSADDFY